MRMNRRGFLGGLAAAAVVISTPSLVAAATRRPNIVVILADDLGYGDVSSYGAKDVATPHIDSLSRQGLRFTNAHTDAATCTPSRYAMMTGSYAWRKDGIAVLPGDAKLLIEPQQATIASVLKSAGYATGLVGKWHIGLGDGTIDWNGEIKPGPCELGFDDAFFFAATADRVPTVYIHNHRVVNLDPADPIHVSYKTKTGNEPTGKEDPELLKMKLSEGHDGTIVDGISRIGWMEGGKSARWVDEQMAATFTGKAVEFIDRNHDKPFLLYFTPSDIHVPRAPAEQFAGKNTCGVRCDVISQLDWSVGQVLAALKRNHLDENTLVIFTSDNGPVVNDGYDDGADRKLGQHKPAGPWRGGKYSIQEGGTRVPFVVRWQGTVKPGTSDALMSQVDLLASFAALTKQAVPAGSAQDSQNMLQPLLGRTMTGRESLVEEATALAIVEGQWKLVDRSQRPGVHTRPETGGLTEKSTRQFWGQPAYPTSPLELYNLKDDPYELHNLAGEHPEMVQRLREKLQQTRASIR
ncbi:sulfatase-like hydrolase/transferase [Terriglobus sp. RCC_193]|uniref:sulfatase-like hydrolase/transferase n=1 Tax=Terriglobus sp. RCC_193 TaxID=3239218 RepID=UPI0035246BD3